MTYSSEETMTRAATDGTLTVAPRRQRGLLGALVGCVRDHPVSEPVAALRRHATRYGVPGLAEAARLHGVTGSLWTALRATGLAERADAAGTGSLYRLDSARHLRVLGDVERVDEVLGGAGLAYLVMAGPVLGEHFYRYPGLRPARRLRVVVAPRDVPLALSSLEESGWYTDKVDWSAALRAMPGGLELIAPSGETVDVQWSPFTDPDLVRAHPVTAAMVMRPAITVELAGRAVRTPDRADALVHVAIRASRAGGHRLVWLKDVEQLAAGADPGFWELLAHRARCWRAGPATALMLARARTMLGAAVPDATLRELAPDRVWRAAVWLTDLVPSVRGGVLRQAVARSAVQDAPASRRELFHRGRPAAARAPVPAPAPARSAGGTGDRTEFLHRVACQDED